MRTYKFEFPETINLDEVEATLLLSIMACESLHGSSQVRLEASHYLDRETRTCVIDASTVVGHDLAKLATGYFGREFGEDGFSISHAENAAAKAVAP